MKKVVHPDDQVFNGRVQFNGYAKFRKAPIYGELEELHVPEGVWYKYDTGWLLNEIGGAATADWTNVHLGDVPTGDSNVTHNLNAPLSDLLVKVLISTDGTDANSLEVSNIEFDAAIVSDYFAGIQIYQVDLNNIKVQTGSSGFTTLSDSGVPDTVSVENWYYKVKVWYLG